MRRCGESKYQYNTSLHWRAGTTTHMKLDTFQQFLSGSIDDIGGIQRTCRPCELRSVAPSLIYSVEKKRKPLLGRFLGITQGGMRLVRLSKFGELGIRRSLDLQPDLLFGVCSVEPSNQPSVIQIRCNMPTEAQTYLAI